MIGLSLSPASARALRSPLAYPANKSCSTATSTYAAPCKFVRFGVPSRPAPSPSSSRCSRRRLKPCRCPPTHAMSTRAFSVSHTLRGKSSQEPFLARAT
eukprot:4017676-Pleurochrysis_carterae.AAC.1